MTIDEQIAEAHTTIAAGETQMANAERLLDQLRRTIRRARVDLADLERQRDDATARLATFGVGGDE